MNTSRAILLLLPLFALACDPADPPPPPLAKPPVTTTGPTTPPPQPAVQGKRVALDPEKLIFFETLPDGSRRVLVQCEVCLRDGLLELVLCKKFTKEHEAVLRTTADGRAIHAALEAAGAKAGATARYQPTFAAPTGQKIRISFEYSENGKDVVVPASAWITESKSGKDLPWDFVFAGSRLIPDPDDANKQPFYGANGGDLISLANFPDAMLDLPVASPKDNSNLLFKANTARIPKLETPVLVILEPMK